MYNQLIKDKISDQDNYEVKANEVKNVIKEPFHKEINKGENVFLIKNDNIIVILLIK
jgi:hypothetical protein